MCNKNGVIDMDRFVCVSVVFGGGVVWLMYFIGMVVYWILVWIEFDFFMILVLFVVVMVFVVGGFVIVLCIKGNCM